MVINKTITGLLISLPLFAQYFPAGGGSGGGGSLTSPLITTPITLPHIKAGILNARTGTSGTRILVVSDSVGRGFNSGMTPDTFGSAWYRLASLLTANGTPAVNALVVPGSLPDSRFSLGSGWGAGSNSTAVNTYGGTGNTGNLVVTPFAASTTVGAFAFSSVKVYVFGNNAGVAPVNPGNYSATCTGGSAGTLLGNAQASQGVYSFTASCGASSATNTITITCTGTSTFCQVLGVELVPTTANQLIFLNYGVSGASSSSWHVSNSGWGGNEVIALIAPNVCVIQDLGVNDSAPGGLNMPPATFQANMAGIIGSCNSSSADTLLMDMPTSATVAQNPGSGDARALLEVQYLPVYKTLYTNEFNAAQNATYISFWNYWAATWNYNNFMCGDSLHPCGPFGYDDMADFLYKTIFK